MSTMPSVKVLKGTLLEKTLLSKLIIVLWICRGNLIRGMHADSILILDVEYLYAECPSDYSCPKFWHDHNLAVPNVTCSCSRQCSQFGTCCLDSPYRHPVPPGLTQTCRRVQSFPRSGNYFMIDRCPSGDSGNPEWERLCNDEWNGENDIMRLVPVTSAFTGITYKNYFCFRCYETTDYFFYWKIRPRITPHHSYYSEADYFRAFGSEGEFSTSTQVKLAYDSVRQSWTAFEGDDSIPIPVTLKFEIPKEMEPLRVECDASVISNCSDKYHFEDVIYRCHSYTAAVYIQENDRIFKYKNAHCALCNFENVKDIICGSHFLGNADGIPGRSSRFEDMGAEDPGSLTPWEDDGSGYEENFVDNYLGRSGNSGKGFFKLNLLIDINGDRQRCEGNLLWDPFAKKCQERVCLPMYVMKRGRCLRP